MELQDQIVWCVLQGMALADIKKLSLLQFKSLYFSVSRLHARAVIEQGYAMRASQSDKEGFTAWDKVWSDIMHMGGERPNDLAKFVGDLKGGF